MISRRTATLVCAFFERTDNNQRFHNWHGALAALTVESASATQTFISWCCSGSIKISDREGLWNLSPYGFEFYGDEKFVSVVPAEFKHENYPIESIPLADVTIEVLDPTPLYEKLGMLRCKL